MKSRKRSAAAVLVVLAGVLGLLWGMWPAQSVTGTDSADLLSRFGLKPKDYTPLPQLDQLRHSDANLSFLQVRDQWYDTVLTPGDRMPLWFERRGGGVFVVTEKPDGSLVGTQWQLTGGNLRLVLCRDEAGRFCGVQLKRFGGTWLMGIPLHLAAGDQFIKAHGPTNLILIDHEYYRPDLHPHTGFVVVEPDEIAALCEDDIDRYGGFIWSMRRT